MDRRMDATKQISPPASLSYAVNKKPTLANTLTTICQYPTPFCEMKYFYIIPSPEMTSVPYQTETNWQIYVKPAFFED